MKWHWADFQAKALGSSQRAWSWFQEASAEVRRQPWALGSLLPPWRRHGTGNKGRNHCHSRLLLLSQVPNTLTINLNSPSAPWIWVLSLAPTSSFSECSGLQSNPILSTWHTKLSLFHLLHQVCNVDSCLSRQLLFYSVHKCIFFCVSLKTHDDKVIGSN